MEEFRPTPKGAPNPLASGGPGPVEDMMWFGLVPGLIINKLRERKAEKDHTPGTLQPLDELSFRELADLEDSLKNMLDAMHCPPDAAPDYAAGYDCHMRLMKWMTEEGARGDAIRHALDDRDGQTLIQHLCAEKQAQAQEPEFFLGFQAANGELASRFEHLLPD